jgi:predicted DNA-binding transcriptional regulator AlpA
MTKLLDDDERLLPRQAATIIGMSELTLGKWRSLGLYGLKFVKIGGRIFYMRKDIDEWLAQRTMTVTPKHRKASKRRKAAK